MNTIKIAALYADPIFNTLLRFPSFDPTTTLTEQVLAHVAREARIVSEDGRRYKLVAMYPHRRERYTDDFGRKTPFLLEEEALKRQADWLLGQMPGWPEAEHKHLRKDAAEEDILCLDVVGYGKRDDEHPENDIKNLGGTRWGTTQDLEIILRGMAAIRRKRRKQAKKLEAQLRAYHAQQEQTQLRDGKWLGAEKALTTAARVDEPGVPFLGDVTLTATQRQDMNLHYWAVSAGKDMSAHFPEGTGIALKQIHRSRELVEGAVYLYQCEWTNDHRTMLLGRAKLAGRTRGHLLLQCDDRDAPFNMPLEWNWPGLKVFRVTHYTTRSAEPEAVVVPLHQPQLRGQRRTRRELQAA